MVTRNFAPQFDREDLSYVNLTGADLSDANLTRASLDHANLCGANLNSQKVLSLLLRETPPR